MQNRSTLQLIYQQRWDDHGIVQAAAVWKGVVSLLDGLDKHFSGHIGKDTAFAQAVPDQAMRQALMQRFYVLNGSPEDYDAEQSYPVVSYGSLVWYLARRIENQQVENQQGNLVSTPSPSPQV